MFEWTRSNMTQEERSEWLKTLKVGDKVANYRTGFNSGWEILEIKNFTPTGKIRLTNGSLLDNRGMYHKYERYGSIHVVIEPITEQVVEEVKRAKLASAINRISHRFDYSKMTTEDLQTVYDILGKYKEDK